MRNKILPIIIVFTIILPLSFKSYAANSKIGGNNNGVNAQIQKQTETSNQGEENQIKSQIEERTQTQKKEEINMPSFIQDQERIREQERIQEEERLRELERIRQEREIREQERLRENLQTQQQTQQPQQLPTQKGININTERYQNTVSHFVRILLNIAEREKGIGEQIRTLAQEQNQSLEKTLQVMNQIQVRTGWKAFLLGPDYKNLGALRSEIVQTRNRLEQLKRLMKNTENEGDRMMIEDQIRMLEREQSEIQNFIKEQEGKFSLFGWLLKFVYGYKGS